VSPAPTSRTRAAEIHDRLRADVLAGRFRPGQALSIAELAPALGVSITVVREALTRLCGDGLVRLEPRAGFRVAELSVAHLLDLTDVRAEVEASAVRRAVRGGDRRWEADVVAAHHLLAVTPPDGDGGGVGPDENMTWWQAHVAFHRVLVAGCGSPLLLGIRDRLWVATELYLRWSLGAGDPTYLQDAAAEHAALTEAAVARDPDWAAAVIAAHVEHTAGVLVAELRHQQAARVEASA